MVRKVENYPYTSHRAYMGIDRAGMVDVDPVLRRFGPRKAVARERYAKHVAAGMKLGHLDGLYETRSGVLGSEEFVDEIIHRMGEFVPKGTPKAVVTEFDPDALIAAVEQICGVTKQDFCGKAKGLKLILAKEALIVSGRRLGASATALSRLAGIDVATVSRRHDAGLARIADDRSFGATIEKVLETYRKTETTESSISQA